MSVRQFVLSSLVLAALARATSVLAEESSDGAVLGPAELIGKLLVVKAGFDDEPAPLPSVPVPLLEPEEFASPAAAINPVAAPTPEGFGVLRPTARITPTDEITHHLTQAILRLMAAGLNDEAKQVSTLLQEFQPKHAARLLLATKQAQLSELQAEIERLKLRVEKGVTSDQVQLSIKLIEVDGQAAKELFADDAKPVNGEPDTRLQLLSSLLDPKEFLRLVESKRQDGALKILADPTLVTQTGRPARFHSGGTIPTPQIAQAGGPAKLEFGTTVLATTTMIDMNLIRVALTVELAELDHANSVNGIPSVRRRRVQSSLELKDGQTVVLSGMVASTETKTVATFLTVTAEIMEPLNELAAPLSAPVEAPQPTPIPIRLVK